jgi:hypothetical protein
LQIGLRILGRDVSHRAGLVPLRMRWKWLRKADDGKKRTLQLSSLTGQHSVVQV